MIGFYGTLPAVRGESPSPYPLVGASDPARRGFSLLVAEEVFQPVDLNLCPYL